MEELKIVEKVDFNGALNYIGSFGRYQLILFVLLSMPTLPSAFYNLCIVFLAGEADHWCAVPEMDGLNITTEDLKKLTLPTDEHE